MLKRTKIVCTVGPSTDNPGVLDSMLAAGMNVARFNFSHGSHEDHDTRIEMVRDAAQKAQKVVALMLDTKGPEMRLGKFAQGKVSLEEGKRLILTTEDVKGTVDRVSVNYKGLPGDVEPGVIILLADGLVSLKVEKVSGQDIITTIQNSGEMSDNKRIAVPGVAVNLPPLSEQDVADIKFGIKRGMDFVAASFIQNAAGVLAIRRVLEDSNSRMAIIAKIENPEGVKNIAEILKVADGVMVARGDLGVEIPAEDVPIVQKRLISMCNKAGKPVITATQMLESMMGNPRPTRAEASDIANAIIDGTDAVMLSGETASGAYPVEAVSTMARIAVRTEQELQQEIKNIEINATTTDAVSHATAQIACSLNAAAIVTSTESGYTARMISKYRAQAVIVAVTPHAATARQTQLLWGVHPLLSSPSCNSDEMVAASVRAAETAGLVKNGDMIVVTAGLPSGSPGTTNMIRVHVVAEVLVSGQGIGQKVATGKVCVVKSPEDIEKYNPGDILVVPGIDESTALAGMRAAAIVAEEGGLSSNAAIVGVNYNVPVVVQADNATSILTDGMVVTVDSSRGIVYEGEIQAR